MSIRLERRWPLWAVLGLALAWLVAAGFEVSAHQPGNVGAMALALLPPLCVAVLVGALLPGAGRAVAMTEVESRLAEANQAVSDLQARLVDVDGLLDSTAGRAEKLVAAALTGAGGLSASAAAMEAAAAKIIAGGEDTRRFTEHFRESLPEIAQAIGVVDSTLRGVSTDSGVQLRAVETMVAAVQARNREAMTQADTAIASMSELLARIDEASTRSTSALSKRAYALDAAVDGVLQRTVATVDHIREQVEARLEALHGGVEASGKQMAFLGDDSTRLFNQRLEALLRASEAMKGQFATHEAEAERLQGVMEAQLQALEARFGDVGRASAAVSETLGATTAANFAQIETRLGDVQNAGASVMEEIGNRASDIDDTLRAAAELRATELEQRFANIEASGTAAVDAIGDRIGMMDAALREAAEAQMTIFEARVVAVRAAATAAVADIGAQVAGIDENVRDAAATQTADIMQRLAEVRSAGAAAMADIAAGTAAVEASLLMLSAPLAATQVAMNGLDGQSLALRGTVADVEGALTERVTDTRMAMRQLEDEANAMLDTVSSLHDSVVQGSELVGAAAAGLMRERSEIERMTAALEGHFDKARDALADIQAGTAEATTMGVVAMRDELARIEVATAAAANQMRVLLTTVIDEGIAALHEAAAVQSEAVAEPVRAQLAAIEDATARAGTAGKVAAERLAAHMVNLVETVAMVDARVGEVDTRFAVRERDSLAARSARLVAQLHESLIDVTRLMALTIKDEDWAQYLRGDRSVFAHAMAPQLDREASRRIARMFQHDPAFREEAARYLDIFEALIQRLLGDRDGEAFAATMLSSDIGKIYVAIAEASDRLPPNRSLN